MKQFQRKTKQHEHDSTTLATMQRPVQQQMIAAQSQRLNADLPVLSPSNMLQLQRTIGNQRIQRHLGQSPSPIEQFSAFQQRLSIPIQAKLAITPAGDKYEKEADAVANHAMQAMRVQRMDDEELMQGMRIQRMDEEELMQGMRVQRMDEEELQMQRQADFSQGGEVDADVESQIQAARGGGQPLPQNLNASMSNAIGADFSGVRVHTDNQSDSLNRSVQAKAFTTGSDIFFRNGAYAPDSSSGQQLIAHELTHVVQQGAAQNMRKKEDS